MGAISYCYRCAVIVRDKDFAAGKAVRVGDRVACTACAKQEGLSAAPPPSPSSTTVRTPRPAVRPPAPPRVEEPEPVAGGSRRGPLLGAAAAAGVLVVGLGAWMLLRRPPGPPPAPPPEVVEKVKAPPPPLPARVDAGTAALEAALRAGREKPSDWSGRLRALQDVSWQFEGTPAAAEARKKSAEVQAEFVATAARLLEEIDAALKPILEREQFGPAIDNLDVDAKRYDLPDWTRPVADRLDQVRRAASLKLDAVKAEASEHRAKGREDEVRRLVARVEAWGMPSLLAKLNAELGALPRPEATAAPDPLAGAPPAEKPRSAEGKAWLESWQAAALKAAAGDVDAAQGLLRKGAVGLSEDEVKREAAADAADFAQVAALRASIRERAAKLPRWRPLAVDVRTADGPKAVSGPVLAADRHRVELKSGFVEWDDVTAASLAAALREPADDARVLALSALLEGEVDAAKGLLGGKADAVGAKYWTWAAGARAKIPRPPAEELEARGLFHAAEKEFRSVDTMAAAIAKYRTLQKDFAGTALARGAAERIAARSDAGKEYFLSGADFALEGTMRLGKDGRAVSDADSAPDEAAGNYAELAFAALPGQAYRCWVLLGGCCRETFTFYLQGSEMTVSVKGKKEPMHPGGNYADTVNPYVTNLRKTHAEHAKGAPKAPSRWEWIAIPLPRYAEPGAKRVRLMTDQQGFGVQAAVVSASRTAPPKSSELAELEKARAAEIPPADPDLLAYWTFDETAGLGCFDLAGGRTATLKGAKRGPGRFEGGLVCAGGSDRAEADAPPMTGDYTVSLWFRKESEAEDWARLAGIGVESERPFGIWEFPKDDNRIKYQIAGGGKWFDIDSTRTVQLHEWAHVAATMKGRRGTLYVNGEKDGEKDLDFDPPAPAAPLSIGWYHKHAGFSGAIDDVRIYARALGDAEIRALANP